MCLHSANCTVLQSFGCTIDFSIIAFKTISLQLPTPPCHCSATAEHTGKWEKWPMARTYSIKRNNTEINKTNTHMGTILTKTFRHHHRWSLCNLNSFCLVRAIAIKQRKKLLFFSFTFVSHCIYLHHFHWL